MSYVCDKKPKVDKDKKDKMNDKKADNDKYDGDEQKQGGVTDVPPTPTPDDTQPGSISNVFSYAACPIMIEDGEKLYG